MDSLVIEYGFKVLENNPNQRELGLSNNALKSLSGLETYPNRLEQFDLSKNNLRTLEPLRYLTNLKDLSLEQNEISSIHELSTLTNLQSLNLIGNKVASTNDLAAISGMNKLTTISLAENPITSMVDYPDSVFALQESLQYVDGWLRPSVAPGQPLLAPMPVGSPEAQLDAANAALGLQERTLGANGHELAKLCASLTPQATKSTAITHHHLSETEILEKFPYFRLLQMWRKEALTAIMARTVMEKRMQDATTEMKRERQMLISRRQEAEMAASLWKERHVGLEKTCNELHQHVHTLAEELRRAADTATQRDAQLAHMTQQMRQLTVYLLHQRNAAHETAVVEAATTAH
eukprot:gene19137-21769_t